LDFQRDEPESIRSFSNSEKETSSSDSEDNPKLIREKRTPVKEKMTKSLSQIYRDRFISVGWKKIIFI